jgi:hypothetical protein
LNRERGTTLVVSTHDLNFAAGLCGRIVLLQEGRVLADGRPEETLTADGFGGPTASRPTSASMKPPPRDGGTACAISLICGAGRWLRLRFGGLALGMCAVAQLLRARRSVSVESSTRRFFADNVDAQIFFIARLPRVLAAAVVGCGLAVSGALPGVAPESLASPDTLGVSAGASLGAMLAITWHADFTFLGISAVPLASFAGRSAPWPSCWTLGCAATRRGRRCCCSQESRSLRSSRPSSGSCSFSQMRPARCRPRGG